MVNSLLHSHLYEWYDSNRRVLPWRETDDGYQIWLSEIILQQTRVVQGLEYYLRFTARWPRVEDLAAASEEEVLREWQGLGYYSRARNLHKAAQQIVASQKAEVESGKQSGYFFPKTYDEIRQLPGVGDYTAGAIASFAYNQPYPAMDGNVYRVVARLLDVDEAFDTSAGKRLFHKHIDQLMDKENARLFNSAIMEFGALWCTPQLDDHCEQCPLQAFCLGYAHGTAALLPVRKPRPKLRDRWLDFHIYLCREGEETYTLIHQRTEKDIWLHLFEFPCTEHTSEPKKDQTALSLTHILSHQRLHARFFIHRVTTLPVIEGSQRIAWQELDDYALSRLTLLALERLGLN